MTLSKTIICLLLAIQFEAGACLTYAASQHSGKGFNSVVPAATLDDPRRDDWQKADKVLDHLLVKKGDVVADVGAGTGYFTMLFAERVSKSGMVYAVDVDESMTDHIIKRVKRNGVSNVKVVLAPPDNTLLAKKSTDLAFLCDTYIFIENRGQYLARLRDVLKSNGRLAILSFNMKPEIPGAPPPHKRVPRETIIQEVENSGFAMEAEYFFLPYQYFLVFAKK
ncbi:methyltransferase domain-containing protein [Geobacter pelophilus]|uniref:Methyltransferase domain-containing protein n=1 Tax=Geoanaerobacter pelophilus TaxID=60036 RepID=A0AAW4L1R7_9BACT|nr:methyltransferase domain-containing protein [Geoanaerobacter pelophilus]MBT0664813.1 methyltransferase domain-containing protein [Geoanaerobacter pelophilus]